MEGRKSNAELNAGQWLDASLSMNQFQNGSAYLEGRLDDGNAEAADEKGECIVISAQRTVEKSRVIPVTENERN